jgi:tetratricopeptide (TPR) repeat protein
VSGDEGPWLLVRDRLQLNDVAAAIREGQRHVAFVVTESQFRPLALDYLREQSQQPILDPVALVDPDQTLQALTEIAKSPATVHSFLVVHSAPDVVRTLNWHREKLRHGKVVLLWIDGVEGLRVLRQLGPDAYSFRDTLVSIQGETLIPVVQAQEETVDMQLARLRYSAAETPVNRAYAASLLAQELLRHNAKIEAQEVLKSALTESSLENDDSEERRIARADLWGARSHIEEGGVARFRLVARGLGELEGINSLDAQMIRIELLIRVTSPLGVHRRAILKALEELELVSSVVPTLIAGSWAVYLQFARMCMAFGTLKQARSALHKAFSLPAGSTLDLSQLLLWQAKLEFEAGNTERAYSMFHSVAKSGANSGSDTFDCTVSTTKCLIDLGEFETARKMLDAAMVHPKISKAHAYEARAQLALISLITGHTHAAMLALRALLHDALNVNSDGNILIGASIESASFMLAHEANRTTASDFSETLADLNLAESVACSIAGDDPPWYSILFPALRAELLALRPKTVEEAISLVSTALERARSVFEDAVPHLARQLVHHLLQAGHLERARDALPALIDEVASVHHLRELVRLRSYQIVAFVRLNAPMTDIDVAMKALRANFDEMDAPRIVADTLLELAEMLPSTFMHIDPYALADEAAALYAEMPYPFQESRALEVMGDVLEGRGKPDEALNCYRSSRGICEKFGFGLRMPRLARKIAPAKRATDLKS